MPDPHNRPTPRPPLLPRRRAALVALAVAFFGLLAGPLLVRHLVSQGPARSPGGAAGARAPGPMPGARVPQGSPVQVTVGGHTLDHETGSARVAGVLAELGVRLGALDRVEPPLDAPVTSGLDIRVTRLREELATQEVQLPFDTAKREAPDLAVGETREVQPGQPGIKAITTRSVYADGRLIETEVVAEEVVREPVTRVVSFGTLGVVSRGGVTYRFREELWLEATGYSPGDGQTPSQYTATGALARRGVVAVDPNYIPLGTRLYVEGYGAAIAADTGGAIKGAKIDLCFDTVQEAYDFGRRTIKVYVLAN